MSTNVSKQRRDELIAKIKEIYSYISQKDQDENTGVLLDYLRDIEKDIKRKKYGLVFEEHREGIDELLETHTPVLTEEQDLFIDHGGPVNFLIEGDNLAALRLLEKTHREKIDIIYIDPPYNTGGSDFIYNDAIVDSEDLFRHSKWLSFMNERLIAARGLLCETGVMLISIGEQEAASLKLLCDGIMGEDNFITIFVRQMKSGGAKGKYYTPSVDYILAYARNVARLPQFKAVMTQKQMDAFYNKVETKGPRAGEKYGEERLFKASLDARPNQRYYIRCPDGSLAIPPGKHFPACAEEGEPILPTNEDKVWKWIYPRYKSELEQGNIVFKRTKTSGLVDEHGNKSGWNIYNKLWLSEQQSKGVVPSNLIQEFENRQSAAELKKIGIHFTYAKPVKLIQYLLTIANQNADCTVLDFFAGSGTTGHAVMKFNEENNACRKFILCTNNENHICRNVTYKRLGQVIKDERCAASLKYFKIDYIPTENRFYYEYADELLRHIRELAELEHGVKLNKNSEIAIILTDEELNELIENEDSLRRCAVLYCGYRVLMGSEQERKLRSYGIMVYVIPEHYYQELEGAK